MARIGTVGVVSTKPKKPPKSVSNALLNATAKTVGNAITGTSPYKTPLWRPPLDLSPPKTPKPSKTLPKPVVAGPSFGKIKPKGKPKPKPKGGGKGGGGDAAPAEQAGPGVYAEADIATTAYLRAQGKAYAAGRDSAGKSKAGGGTNAKTDKQDKDEAAANNRRRRNRRSGPKGTKGRPNQGRK